MSRAVRLMLAALAGTLLAVSVMAATASPASAGISRCLGLWAYNNRVEVQHQARCGPNGVYHIHVWGGGHENNTRNYLYSGRAVSFSANWPAAEGTKICGELWFHEGSGKYSSWGLPCDNM